MPTFWNPAPLNAAVQLAFKDAAFATARAIESGKPESRIPITGPFFLDGGNRAVIRTGGLAPIFEKGAKPHQIFPKGAKTLRRSKSKGQTVFKLRSVRGHTSQVLRLANGRVVRYVLHHPGMAAQPFIRPEVDRFPMRYRLAGTLRLGAMAARRLAA